MINVILYKNFAKDANSTKQPTGDTGAVSKPYNCDIYEPCSIMNPVLLIREPGTTLQEQGYSYAYVNAWHRYYWITDMVFAEGAWRVHLTVDVLASFKGPIAGSTQYVMRSAAEYNEEIIDTAYTPTGPRQDAKISTGVSPFATSITGGTFILGITTGNSVATGNSTMGTTTYISMIPSELQQLINVLWGSGDYLNLLNTDLETDVAKLIINPLQYIQSCIWIPIPLVGGSVFNNIQLGWWSLNVSGTYALYNGSKRKFSFFNALPVHPQVPTHGKYVARPPYSQYVIVLPVIGELELPGERIDANMPLNLLVEYSIDLITGTAELTISQTERANIDLPGKTILLVYTTCDMAVNIPLAQLVTDKVGAATSAGGGIIGGISSILSGQFAQGIMTMVNGAVDAGIKASTPIPSFMGTAGNMSLIGKVIECHNFYQELSPTDFVHLGRPLCATRQLQYLPGFIMCARAHMAIPGAMAQEVEQVENYLNTGFYYE